MASKGVTMSEHGEEVSVVASRNVDETNNRRAKQGRISRRRFLRSAVIGVGAVVAFEGVNVGLRGASVAYAADTSGEVTLDALLITYVGAPIASRSSTSWSYSKRRTNTFKLTLGADQSISLQSDTTNTTTDPVDKSKFTVENSLVFKQSNSAQFTTAIVVQESQSRSLNTTVRNGVAADAGDTVFFGLLAPDLTFTGNPVNGFRYRFLKATSTFTVQAFRFQSPDATILSLFRQSTITAFLNQYPPTSATTPVEPGSILRKPRFKLVESNFATVGTDQALNRTLSNGSSFSLSLTSTFGATITRSTGFQSGDGSLQTKFGVGQAIMFTVSGVQESSTENVISVTANLVRATDGVTKIYRDKVWKTFVILDAGVPGPPAVQGRVTDWFGSPIARATVYLTQNNTYYSTATDANGNYSIATASGQPLTSGTYPITCGNVSQWVAIGSSTTYQNFGGVDPVTAQNTNLDLALLQE